MSKQEFRDIFNAVNDGLPGFLRRTLDCTEYTRKFLPPERLIVLGCGHIAQPLCQIGAILGFHVTVIDDRPSFASWERFPQATAVIADEFSHAIQELNIAPTDYVCIVTRGHRFDTLCLRTILSGRYPAYLGMIGSHRRVAGNIQMLLEEGYDPAELEKLHAPIGLAIGAVTPQEIAVSIMAQIIETRRAGAKEANFLAQTNTDSGLLQFLSEANHPMAMLMVLSSTGSTPVKPGSMMGVDALGQVAGTIGGGCSENAALIQARHIISTGTSKIITVDMSNDLAEEEGMVCGGSMTVLIEDVTGD